MSTHELTLTSLDGRPLAATAYEPAEAPKASVVILGALGVPRGYYRHFGAWLAAHGVATLTMDYRGVGGSRLASVRRDPATLLEWGQLDASALIDAARERWGGCALWGVGHSFGGQAFGLTPRARDLDGAIVVAAGSGDMRLYPARLRRRYRLQLGLAIPTATAVFGYMPGRLGLGQDLPSGVVRQWARWCLTPDYVRGALGLDATHHHRLDIPMRFFEVSDDDFAPEAPAAALRGWYSSAQAVHTRLTPQDLGAPRVGHFGVFRPQLAEPLWAQMLGSIAPEAALHH